MIKTVYILLDLNRYYSFYLHYFSRLETEYVKKSLEICVYYFDYNFYKVRLQSKERMLLLLLLFTFINQPLS
jgi:hypothetical protein